VITINLCIRRLRPAREVSFDEIDDLPGREKDTVLKSVMGSIESAELRTAVAGLPPAYRSVIVLRYLEEMSYAQIA